MGNLPRFYDATVEAGVNAVTALLNSGTIAIYSGAQPALNGAVAGTLIATLKFGATAFGASSASGGVVTATANSITSGTAVATQTASYFMLQNAGANVATGTISTSGADLNLNSVSISTGAIVSCSAFTITEIEALNG